MEHLKGKKEGVDYINVSIKSNSNLGKRLSMNYVLRPGINLFCGKAVTVGNFLDYIRDTSMDKSILYKGLPRHMRKKHSYISTHDIPNYYALMVYAVCTRVYSDPALMKDLKQNKLPLEAFEVRSKIQIDVENLDLSDEVYYVQKPQLKNYLDIILDIQEMIKAGQFNKAGIKKLIEEYKDDPSLPLTAGIHGQDYDVVEEIENSPEQEQ